MIGIALTYLRATYLPTISEALGPIVQDLINSLLENSADPQTVLLDHLQTNKDAYKQILTNVGQKILTDQMF